MRENFSIFLQEQKRKNINIKITVDIITKAKFVVIADTNSHNYGPIGTIFSTDRTSQSLIERLSRDGNTMSAFVTDRNIIKFSDLDIIYEVNDISSYNYLIKLNKIIIEGLQQDIIFYEENIKIAKDNALYQKAIKKETPIEIEIISDTIDDFPIPDSITFKIKERDYIKSKLPVDFDIPD